MHHIIIITTTSIVIGIIIMKFSEIPPRDMVREGGSGEGERERGRQGERGEM